MRVEADLDSTPSASVLAYVVTGDGRAEYEVLRGIAKKYNGRDKVLLFQKSPKRKITGIHVLKSIKTIHKINSYTSYLVLLDKEHFDRKQFMRLLRESFSNPIVKEDGDLYIIKDTIFRIFLVLLGHKRRIEENLTSLIELKFNIKIEPEKHVIRKYLRENGIKSREKLIAISSKKEIEKAFSSLAKVLKILEK